MYNHMSVFYKEYKGLTNLETSLPLSCSGGTVESSISPVERTGTGVMEKKIQNIKSCLHQGKKLLKDKYI